MSSTIFVMCVYIYLLTFPPRLSAAVTGVWEGLESQFLLSEHLAENKIALSRSGSMGKCSSQAAVGDQIAQWDVV